MDRGVLDLQFVSVGGSSAKHGSFEAWLLSSPRCAGLRGDPFIGPVV